MKLKFLFLICSILYMPLFGQAKKFSVSVPLGDLVSDARGSFEQGDLYRSLKIYLYLKEKKPKYFYKNTLKEFVKVYGKLSSKEKLVRQCKALSASAPETEKDTLNYACGREFLKKKENDLSTEYLQLVKSSSEYFEKSKLLMASIFLSKSAADLCIKSLSKLKEEKIKAQEIHDIFYITRARCFAIKKSYNKAIADYQQVPSSSRYYMNSLEETTWSYFKLKDKASAYLVGNVVASSYQGDKFGRYDEENFVTSISYFNTKYILAYMDLSLTNNISSKNKFKELENEILNYQNSFKTPKEIVLLGLKEIADPKVSWIRLQSTASKVKEIIQFSKDWVGIAEASSLEEEIRWQIAINKELERFRQKKYKSSSLYFKALNRLYKYNLKKLREKMVTIYASAKKLTGTLALKSKIGNVEYDWLTETNGIRSVEEAAVMYKEKEGFFSRYMGD